MVSGEAIGRRDLVVNSKVEVNVEVEGDTGTQKTLVDNCYLLKIKTTISK